MRSSELKDLTIDDLREQIFEQETIYRKMKMNNKVSTLENPLSVRTARRNLARLKTELTARRKSEEKKLSK